MVYVYATLFDWHENLEPMHWDSRLEAVGSDPPGANGFDYSRELAGACRGQLRMPLAASPRNTANQY
ncbi:hypothetical protein D3C84_1006390 [compost metagenome]